MASKILRVLLAEGEVKEFYLDEPLKIQAEAGATYSVVDSETHNVVEGLLLKRDEESLLVEVDGEVVVTVDNFYDGGYGDTVSSGGTSGVNSGEAPADSGTDDGNGAGPDGIAVTSDNLWVHTADTAAGAGALGGTKAAFVAGGLLVTGGALYTVSNDDETDGDVTPPDAPVIDPVAADDIINGGETDSVITGTTEADATISLSIGGNTRTLTADGTGAWSYTLIGADIAAMGQGEELLSATARDASGNTSGAGTRSITVDTLVPGAPTVGTVATDDIINISEQASLISGTAEGGAEVALSIGANTRTFTADGSGAWSYTLTVADIAAMGQGGEVLSATATDGAGNTSIAGTRSITVDTVAPTPPVIGTVQGDDIINLAESTGAITGTSEAGATIDLTVGGNLRTVTADGGGNWSYTLTGADITAMGQGIEALSATATDGAGNTGAAGTRAITVDTIVPAPPVIDAVATDDIINIAESGSTITGTAEAGATVDITLGAGNVRTVTADGSGNWSYTLIPVDITAMGEGPETVSATATDGAGNTSSPGTRSITIDTVAPVAPVIGAVAVDDIVNGAEQSSIISGTAEAGSTIDLTIGGNVRTFSADGAGNWSYTLVAADIAAMGEGAETLSATATDGVGNTGVAGTRAITVDTVAPPAPTIGAVATDDVINNSEQTSVISGTAEAGGTVNLTVGGNVRNITADGGGSWSYTLIPADIASMGEGGEILSATTTDVAGNTGPAGARSIFIDTIIPSAPVISTVAGDDTINASEVGTTITGTSEASSTVALTIGGNVRTFSADGAGNWSYTLVAADITAMGEGGEVLSATATDSAGNTSAAGTLAITVDTVIPSVPVIDTVAGDDKINASEVGTTITGTGESGATLDLTIGGNVRSVTVGGGGTWSYALTGADITAMGEGGETLSATQTDAAGNTSSAAIRPITVDTIVPSAPVINAVATDDIIDASETATAITGTAEAGATIDITIGAGNVRTVTADGGGAWSYTLVAADITAMGEGGETLSATATDSAGNTSIAATRPIFLDTIVPAPPVFSTVAVDDIINSAEQGSVISGTAEANSTVNLTVGGNVKTLTADPLGNWSYTLIAADIAAMGEGGEILSATATDGVGNESTSGTHPITVDTVVPPAPVISTVAGDDVINLAESTGVISGTGEANATIDLTIAGNLRTVTAGGGGAWSYTLQPADITAMGQGGELLSATQTDVAGNTGSAATRTVTVDTLVPAAPTIDVVAGDDIINLSEIGAAITGTAEAGATVDITIGAGNVRTVTAGGGGAWSYTLISADITAMGQGGETLSATATDSAGNTSTAATRVVTVDTVAPGAPVINTVATDNIINAVEVGATITGTAEAGTTVNLTVGGNVKTLTADGAGNWSYTLLPADITAMGEGLAVLSATATDVAGNTGPSGSRLITVDTAAPGAPTIDLVAGDDTINGAEVGTAITGTAEAGATVDITIGAGNVRTVTAGGGGTWSYSLVAADITAMGQGGETLSATATDTAGNTSTTGTRGITVDTAAPGAPVINAVSIDDIIDTSEVGSAITGTAEAGATIDITIGAGNIRTVTADGGGVWSYSLVAADFTAMGVGPETLSATATDSAGNTGTTGTRGITVQQSVDTSIVVFDLVSGVSSSHSGRVFDGATTYDVYIRVDSNSATLNTANEGMTAGTWGTWTSAGNLGADDTITLVGNGPPVSGPAGFVTTQHTVGGVLMLWRTPGASAAATLASTGFFARSTGSSWALVQLWSGSAALSGMATTIPGGHLMTMPAGVLTSQGLV